MRSRREVRLSYKGHRRNFRKHMRETSIQFDQAQEAAKAGNNEDFGLHMAVARESLNKAVQHFHELNAHHNMLNIE